MTAKAPRSPRLSHLPVLFPEVLAALAPVSGGRYIDGTVGAGGHARGILERSAPGGRLLGLDLDPAALALAADSLQDFGERCRLVEASYTRMAAEAGLLGWDAADGVLLDLGVSSMQLDDAGRGFSFREDAPLDMRFSPQGGLTARELVNSAPEAELASILREYGEEREAGRIARAIVNARPVETTGQLAALVERALRRGRSLIHPATRTFQALRIAVNMELDNLRSVLPAALALLRPGGRLAVISFHSLEDRIVKQYFQQESRDCLCPPGLPECRCGHKASLKWLKPAFQSAGADEIRINPRARSAKLRTAEKLA